MSVLRAFSFSAILDANALNICRSLHLPEKAGGLEEERLSAGQPYVVGQEANCHSMY
jgi:hypothetical protein